MKLLLVFVFCIGTTITFSQELPLSEGVYARSTDYCSRIVGGDLDYVELEVRDQGRVYLYPEVFCATASVKQIRENRFIVEGDCQEALEYWQDSFILDVLSPNELHIDGRKYHRCEATASTAGGSNLPTGWAEFLSQPIDTVCVFNTVRSTYNYWWLSDSEKHADLEIISEISKGTEVYLIRSAEPWAVIGPQGIDLMGEFRGYFVPSADIEFAGQCGPSR